MRSNNIITDKGIECLTNLRTIHITRDIYKITPKVKDIIPNLKVIIF